MVKIEIDIKQIKKAIESLPLKERAKLVEELQKETVKNRYKELLKRVKQSTNKNPVSQKDIDRETAIVRKRIYGKSGH